MTLTYLSVSFQGLLNHEGEFESVDLGHIDVSEYQLMDALVTFESLANNLECLFARVSNVAREVEAFLNEQFEREYVEGVVIHKQDVSMDFTLLLLGLIRGKSLFRNFVLLHTYAIQPH